MFLPDGEVEGTIVSLTGQIQHTDMEDVGTRRRSIHSDWGKEVVGHELKLESWIDFQSVDRRKKHPRPKKSLLS